MMFLVWFIWFVVFCDLWVVGDVISWFLIIGNLRLFKKVGVI